jgi:hypothetical protein
VQLAAFTQTAGRLTPTELRTLAAALAVHASTVADEAEAWHATLAIDRALRRSHRTRVAARAARDTSHAVLAAAIAHAVPLPDDDVTRVARAAAEIARGMVAGPEAVEAVEALLTPWELVVGVAV